MIHRDPPDLSSAPTSRPRRRRIKRPKVVGRNPQDPFGLEGFHLSKDPLTLPLDPWIEEIRVTIQGRWEIVNRLWAEGRLQDELKEEAGLDFSRVATSHWYHDRQEDHLWRMRLLDPAKQEGALYRALMHTYLKTTMAILDRDRTEALIQKCAYLLDLDPDHPAHPGFAPALRGHHPLPVDGSTWMDREAPRLHYTGIEGMAIPRRYSKARAQRAIADLQEWRGREYWRVVASRVQDLGNEVWGPWKKWAAPALAEYLGGPEAIDLVKTVRRPAFEPFGVPARKRRSSSLTADERSNAKRLFERWYPLVAQVLRGGSAEAGLMKKIRAAQDRGEQQVKRVVLEMIREELNLPVGIERLSDIVGPSPRSKL